MNMKTQEPDTIYLGGKIKELHTFPLETYWQGKRKKPVFVIFSTACWRGYKARWVIIDKELFLTDISGKMLVPVDKKPVNPVTKWIQKMLKRSVVHKNREVDAEIGYLFPGRKENRVKASWFTGNLRIQESSCREKSNKHKTGITGYETVITVHRGNVVLQTKESISPVSRTEYRLRERIN